MHINIYVCDTLNAYKCVNRFQNHKSCRRLSVELIVAQSFNADLLVARWAEMLTRMLTHMPIHINEYEGVNLYTKVCRKKFRRDFALITTNKGVLEPPK